MSIIVSVVVIWWCLIVDHCLIVACCLIVIETIVSVVIVISVLIRIAVIVDWSKSVGADSCMFVVLNSLSWMLLLLSLSLSCCFPQRHLD